MDEQQTPPAPRLARRRIAYVMTGLLCAVSCGAFFRELAEPNADIVMACIYAAAAIVLGYMGVQAAPDVFRRG